MKWIKNIIKKKDKDKAKTKDISSECKYKFDGKAIVQIKGGITVNFNVSVKKFMYVKKIMFWILLPLFVKMKNLATIMDDSDIIFDEVIKTYDEEIKTILTNFNKKYNL